MTIMGAIKELNNSIKDETKRNNLSFCSNIKFCK